MLPANRVSLCKAAFPGRNRIVKFTALCRNIAITAREGAQGGNKDYAQDAGYPGSLHHWTCTATCPNSHSEGGLCSRNGCGPTQKNTFLTTSRPLVTEPNTTCLPSSHAVCKIVSRLVRLCTHKAHAFGEP
jgi:hypothetical protein